MLVWVLRLDITGKGFSRSSAVKHLPAMQYPCLDNPHGQKTLTGYCPWSRKESDTTEGLSIAQLQKNTKEYFGQPNIFLGNIYLKTLFLGIVLVVPKKLQLQNEKGTMSLTLLDRINVHYDEFTYISSLILHSVGMQLFSSFLYQKNLSVREINISNITQLLKAWVTSPSLQFSLHYCLIQRSILLILKMNTQ